MLTRCKMFAWLSICTYMALCAQPEQLLAHSQGTWRESTWAADPGQINTYTDYSALAHTHSVMMTMIGDDMAAPTCSLALTSSIWCFSPSTACARLPPALLRFMVAWRVSGLMVLVLPSTPILRVPCLLRPVGLKGMPVLGSFWTLYLSSAASQSPPCKLSVDTYVFGVWVLDIGTDGAMWVLESFKMLYSSKIATHFAPCNTCGGKGAGRRGWLTNEVIA